MIAYLEQVGCAGEVDDGQYHNMWFVQSRQMFDLSEVGLRQQAQYNAQLEHHNRRCFSRSCMLGITYLRKGMPRYS
jgi:hypothetical protein